MIKNGMRPIHPGEILRAEYLEPLGISAHALAKALKVPPSRIGDIVLERRGITPDSALRLARYFGGDAQSWLNLQLAYDLKMAEKALQEVFERDITPYAEAAGDVRFALAS
ncbi:MAG: addiction module antidote protein, HigA family [Curvibacter sp.]|nr:MAG: addiction module antidote protein, HigA family [Curvibacter sp.]